MRMTPLIITAAGLGALMACTQASPPDPGAGAGRNAAAPTAPAGAGAGGSGDAAPGNGLWGVAEAEDEASHRGLDFIAFNRTGRTVTALMLRPEEGPLAPGAPETPWGGDVLTQAELPDGQRAAAHYEADIELCRWQLRATFDDGRTRDWPAVNLCETIRVDLR